MIALLGQVVMHGMGIGQLAIYIVVIAGIVALAVIGIKAMGLAVPQWVIQAFWVLVIVFVIVCAIRLLLSM